MKSNILSIACVFLLVFIISCSPETVPENEVLATDQTGAVGASQQENPTDTAIRQEPASELPPNTLPEVITQPTESEAKAIAFAWSKDSSFRIEDGSVPFVYGLKDGKVRLYYCNSKGILSA